ncbi:hypothetical protein [Pseudomonas frederiksbergensis]|uniref:hypothetical protein n=1 Tax=Pseudomonas frederiksbergensis TaxID=104087 RepID=UPI0032E3CA5A
MQASNVVQGFRLKKILGWTVGTIAAWAVTKMFDSYYDVSLLSALWNSVLSVGSWLGQSFPIQLWMLAGLTICVLLLLGVGFWTINDANRALEDADKKLNAAYEQIAELKTPALPPLTKEQDKVIAAIAAYDSEGEDCSTRDFPGRIGLTLLEADGAMDVLEARKLISFQYYNAGRFVTLTPAGRAHVLHPDFVIPQLFQSRKR